MVTKRVIVPPRTGGETPGDPGHPPAHGSDGSIDTGPPTMPLDGTAPMPMPAAEPPAAPAPRMHAATADPDPDAGDDAAPAGGMSAFWPLLLVGASWLAWMGYHMWQLDRDRQSLANLRTQLEQPTARSAQVRQALDALAADTKRLADGGNPNARLLVEELRRRGVTIDPSAGGASAPK